MDAKLDALIAKLTKWHWSPEFPTAYVKEDGSGIGRIALAYPGGFNLAWHKYKGNFGDHVDAISYTARVNLRLESVKINSVPLSEIATLHTPRGFYDVYKTVRNGIPSYCSELIDEAFHEKV